LKKYSNGECGQELDDELPAIEREVGQNQSLVFGGFRESKRSKVRYGNLWESKASV
jgi:hypothetical protein